MKARVRRMDLPEGRRALAVSDIHGNLPFLKALLDKAGFGPEDLLFVVGDFLEKGAESLATLRYLMELSRAGNVYTLLGNCDDLVLACADGEEGSEDGLYGYLIARPESTVHQMAAEHGFRLESRAGLPELRRLLRSEFRPELDFLRALPHIIDTPRFLFVHGGVPSEHRLEELDAWKCMKNDDFLHQDTHIIPSPHPHGQAPHLPGKAHHQHRRRLRPQVGRPAQRPHPPGGDGRGILLRQLRRPAHRHRPGRAGGERRLHQYPLV